MTVPSAPSDVPKRHPVDQTGDETLRANLASLSRRFSEARERTHQADVSGYSYERPRRNELRIGRTEEGQHRWLAEERREKKDLPRIRKEFCKRLEERETRLYVLAGFGTGQIVAALAETIAQRNVCILVLEPDAALFRSILSLTDQSDLLDNGRLFFAVGEDWLDQAEGILDRYHLCTLPELCLLLRQTKLEAGLRQRYGGWLQELHQRKEHLRQRLEQQVVEFLECPRVVSLPSLKKVWVHEQSTHWASFRRAQWHVSRAFCQAMTESGCTVTGPPYEAGTFYPPFYALHHLMETDPDLVFIINTYSTDPLLLGKNFSDRLQVPKVCWFMDAPGTGYQLLQDWGLSRDEIVLSTDARWFEDVRQATSGVAERAVHVLPLAATYHQVGPRDEAWECPVSFVGQLQDLRASMQSPKLSKAARKALDQIVEAIIRGRGRRPEQLLREDPELVRLGRHYDLKMIFERYYLQLIWEANSRHRLRTLRPLADLGLRVYGSPEWGQRTQGTPLEPCFTGRTVAHQDLPRLFYNSAVNVNIHHLQSSTSLNLRVFDVPAAGGFLITDYMEGLEELFELDREVVVYRSPDELREKVLYYLDHLEERREIAERARARVMRDHTFANRWQALLESLRKEGWTYKDAAV